VACLERGVELTHAIPLLGDLLSVDGLVGAADQRCKRTIVAVRIDPVDALVLDSSDARAEAQAQHGEGGEVNPLELLVSDVRGQLRHRVDGEVTTVAMTAASTAQMSSGEGSSRRASVRKLRVKPS